MKKLLVAAIGAAAAIGAFADPWYSGTSFESLDAGTNVLETAEGVNWQTNGAPTLTVRDITGEYVSGLRSDYFRNHQGGEDTITKGLSIKTNFGEPAYRSSGTAKTMGEVYVDVLVKPTICDLDTNLTLDNGAKIAIWLQENDSVTPAITNLMVTAGYIDSEGNVVKTNYNCGAYGTTFTNGAADDWQRFTIKSFATIKTGETWPAFVVFRNGKAVGSGAVKCDGNLFDNLDADPAAYHRNGCLFPSLVKNATTISAIGFDGTGDVDDILFTDAAESWATTKKITLAWDEHVTGFTYAIGNADPVTLSNLSGADSVEVAVDVQADIAITEDAYASGYIAGTFTSSDSGITVDGKTFRLASLDQIGNAPTCTVVSAEHIVYMTVNDTPCYSVADAITAVNGTTGPATLSLNRAIALEEAITFGSETLTGVTLDLNGQALTYDGEGYAITASKPLTIIDSATGGSITAAEVVTNTTGLLTISAGTFNGKVAIGGTAAITGGTFTGTVAAESATGFITGGTFASKPTDSYVAYGYKASDSIPSTVAIGNWTITYYDDDGETVLTGLQPTSYTFNTDVSLPTPSKSGYTFDGWENVSGTEFVYTKGTTIGNLELYASWTPVAVPTFTLTAAAGANMTVAVYTNDVVEVVGVNDDYTIASNDTAKIVYTAASGYKIEGQDTYTTNIVVEANVTVTAPTATGGEGWDPDPSAIDEKKTAAQEYPALAESPLATANAKTLTTWAKAKSIDFSAVKSATTEIVESYLLNCAPADLEAEKAAFKLDISFDASGNPVVSLPVGKEYNVTPTMKGSNDLSTWTVTDSTTGYQFFKYELSL